MNALRLRLTNVLLVLILLALVAVIAMLATDARGGPLDPPAAPASTDSVRLPGTAISGPTTIAVPGHYYLTRDINVSGAQAAIIISASSVSLDLGGFSLDGTDDVGSYGVWVFGPVADIRVINGTVRDFQFGLMSEDASRVIIENVHAASNARGFHLGDLHLLSDCTAVKNTETGIYLPGDYSTVRDCVSMDNGSDGIAIAGVGNTVLRNQARVNDNEDIRYAGPGIFGGIFRDNVAGNFVLQENGNGLLHGNTCGGAIINPGTNFISDNYFC